jgi:hypothetical protein
MKETAQTINDETFVGIYPEDLFSGEWWIENVVSLS